MSAFPFGELALGANTAHKSVAEFGKMNVDKNILGRQS